MEYPEGAPGAGMSSGIAHLDADPAAPDGKKGVLIRIVVTWV